QPGLAVLDRNGAVISKLTDGDSIKLQIKIANPADQPLSVSFSTTPDNQSVAECTVAKGSDTCQTELFASLGWYWSKIGQPQKSRTIRANSTALAISASADVEVASRPVVFAHGFGSAADAWTEYTHANGYLAPMGVRGFAVGDGQVAGKLNLGSLANPTGKTETLLSNAEILRDYIANVKKATGAQMVDLVSHSMGGLVSRYYIDRVMPGRDVAQLIMLGPPNQGTDCAYLPSSLGYYLPSALEIRPSYVRNVFNQQITHRHGVPFTVIAGTPIVEAVKSPCAAVPSDLAIAFDSASGIIAPVKQSDAWHTDLNMSERVFADFVKPLLQKTIGEFPVEPDPAPRAPTEDDLQFTQVFTGHVSAGASETRTINIDTVTVANFALFDPTRSLTITVRGATGNVIALDPTRNGLVVVKDPATLVYLGYGFTNPRPGPWQVTLAATNETPSSGADYALTAQLKGGAVLKAHSNTLLPKHDETVQLSARLELAGQALSIRDAHARVRSPDGATKTIVLTSAGNEWKTDWKPGVTGLHGIDVVVNGNAPDGTIIERSAFLSVDVQPTPEQVQSSQLLFGAGIGLVGIVIVTGILLRRRGKRRTR
ncbi:partial Lipase EstA, partial [Anaerolineae bacterium]